jgi:foldase protein PrsA
MGVAGLVVVAVTGIVACGAGRTGDAAVRVADVVVTRATVARWTQGMAAGRTVSDPAKRTALEQQALSFLISSRWLVGEAAERGLGPSEQALQRAVEQKTRSSFPGGNAELDEFLRATHQTAADFRFEVEAELCAALLRQAVKSDEPKIAPRQVAAYYTQHRSRYAVPERRELEITNRKSAAAVDELKRELAGGRALSSATRRGWVDRPETLHPRAGSGASGHGPLVKDTIERAPFERAIFTAKKNTLIGPVKFRVDYFLLEVKRVAPARVMTLSQVSATITKQLKREQQHRTLAAFVRAWRVKWRAKTDCAPGYVVQKCRQYRGPLQPESAYTLD